MMLPCTFKRFHNRFVRVADSHRSAVHRVTEIRDPDGADRCDRGGRMRANLGQLAMTDRPGQQSSFEK